MTQGHVNFVSKIIGTIGEIKHNFIIENSTYLGSYIFVKTKTPTEILLASTGSLSF